MTVYRFGRYAECATAISLIVPWMRIAGPPEPLPSWSEATRRPVVAMPVARCAGKCARIEVYSSTPVVGCLMMADCTVGVSLAASGCGWWRIWMTQAPNLRCDILAP
ncbi:hypothetical protein IMZ48_35045 [Candidatus Bathyarchaeota archaeon]|nr:hypothetical protein [Candidatus Bathyarchaeota archaeon]